MITNKEIKVFLVQKGLKLKKLRKFVGLTQQQLADRAYLSRCQISNIENGKTDYTISSYVKYLKALK